MSGAEDEEEDAYDDEDFDAEGEIEDDFEELSELSGDEDVEVESKQEDDQRSEASSYAALVSAHGSPASNPNKDEAGDIVAQSPAELDLDETTTTPADAVMERNDKEVDLVEQEPTAEIDLEKGMTTSADAVTLSNDKEGALVEQESTAELDLDDGMTTSADAVTESNDKEEVFVEQISTADAAEPQGVAVFEATEATEELQLGEGPLQDDFSKAAQDPEQQDFANEADVSELPEPVDAGEALHDVADTVESLLDVGRERGDIPIEQGAYAEASQLACQAPRTEDCSNTLCEMPTSTQQANADDEVFAGEAVEEAGREEVVEDTVLEEAVEDAEFPGAPAAEANADDEVLAGEAVEEAGREEVVEDAEFPGASAAEAESAEAWFEKGIVDETNSASHEVLEAPPDGGTEGLAIASGPATGASLVSPFLERTLAELPARPVTVPTFSGCRGSGLFSPASCSRPQSRENQRRQGSRPVSREKPGRPQSREKQKDRRRRKPLAHSNSFDFLTDLPSEGLDINLESMLREVTTMKTALQPQGAGRVKTAHFASRGPLVEMTEEKRRTMAAEKLAADLRRLSDMRDANTPEKKTDRRREFEGKEDSEKFQTRLRANLKVRRSQIYDESGRFLNWMKDKGGGNITIAWRRYFDSDGDGELSFTEFCNALAVMRYDDVDAVELWQQFGCGIGNKTLSLEALDPHGSKILDFFAGWCQRVMGGPMEVFTYMDADHSDSLEPDEFAEGLKELGFFDVPGLPVEIDNEDKVIDNLYNLLDQNGSGCVQADQMLFLEQDRSKRDQHNQAIRTRQSQSLMGPREEVNEAEKMLDKTCRSQTQIGGTFWKQIPENNVLPSSVATSRAGSMAASLAGSPKSRSPSGMRTPGKMLKATTSATNFFSVDNGYPGEMLSMAGSGSPSSPSSQRTGDIPALSSCFAGPLPIVQESPSKAHGAQRGRLACLGPSASLPSLLCSPDIEKMQRRIAQKKNNEAIRKTAKRNMQSARAKYGGALTVPLPPVNPKEPFVPAKASLILPDYRRFPKARGEHFHPRGESSFDFFRSCKSQSLLDHYYHGNA